MLAAGSPYLGQTLNPSLVYVGISVHMCMLIYVNNCYNDNINIPLEYPAMTVPAFLNQKSGTGKTTLSLNVAYGLAQAGERVLLIDADQQASANA